MATEAMKKNRLIVRDGNQEHIYVRAASRPVASEGRWFDLVHQFPLRPFKSDRDLDAATDIMHVLIDKGRRTRDEDDYLDVLTDLIEEYEDKHYPIPDLSPADFLRVSIQEKGITQTELAKATGISTAVISHILSGRRKMTLDHIKAFAAYFHCPVTCFIEEPKAV